MLKRLASSGQRFLRIARSSVVMRRRSLISILLISNIIFLSFGVRFRGALLQDLSIPFPCQGGSCGCRDAHTCWNNCCCNTAEERLAWAQANGVTPPENIMQRLLQEAAIVKSTIRSSQQVAGCCAAKAKSCCETSQVTACSASSEQSGCNTDDSQTSPAKPTHYRGPFFTVTRCGGLPELYAIFSSSVVERVAPSWSPRLLFHSYLLARDRRASSHVMTPVSPPPDATLA